MIRYLKYIVLVFGGIGLLIGCFFYYQNKSDINHFFLYKNTLSYDSVKENCPEAINKYFYPCFKKNFNDFIRPLSLTGSSIALKLAFNFMDEDRLHTDKFSSEKEKELNYTLNYLEINNIVINAAFNNYSGIGKLYPGFIISLERFYKKAYEFSENLLIGLDGDDGLASLADKTAQTELSKRLELLKQDFVTARDKSRNFVAQERLRLEGNAQ